MKKLVLHIPTPYTESWQALTPVEQGRFCQQCAKTVVDFTTFDEKQLRQYFRQYRGSVCGRLQMHQLQTDHYPKKHYSAPSRLALLLALGLTGNSGLATAQKQVVLAFQEDFNEGSFQNMTHYTTKDWQHINPGGGITKGREAVLREVRAVHQTFLKGVKMTIESMSVRFITPQVGIADVIHQMGSYELPPGIKHDNEKQMKTYVLVKQGNQWWLTHDQNTIITQKP